MNLRPVHLAPLLIAFLLTNTYADDTASGPVTTDGWNVTVGMGVASGSKYPGSDEQKTLVMPTFGANYGRFFVGMTPGINAPLGAGLFLVQDTHWHLGVGLGLPFMKARKESDSTHLRGLGDIDGTALASAFASYDTPWFGIQSSVTTDVAGRDQGTRISLGFEGRYPLTERLHLAAGPGITWGDSTYTQTFFGVTAAQSANSGLPIYTPNGGINSIRFSAGIHYRLTPNWDLGANTSVSSLRGDAADSPITLKKTQTQFSLFAAYRF